MMDSHNQEEKELEEVVFTRLMRLNSTIFGIVFGLVFGIGLFVATIWLVIKGGPVVGPNLALLGHFFIGYDVTLLGSIIGLIYGFVFGFIFGFVIAGLYNLVLDLRDRNRS